MFSKPTYLNRTAHCPYCGKSNIHLGTHCSCGAYWQSSLKMMRTGIGNGRNPWLTWPEDFETEQHAWTLEQREMWAQGYVYELTRNGWLPKDWDRDETKLIPRKHGYQLNHITQEFVHMGQEPMEMPQQQAKRKTHKQQTLM